jgi:hypothetical protein
LYANFRSERKFQKNSPKKIILKTVFPKKNFQSIGKNDFDISFSGALLMKYFSRSEISIQFWIIFIPILTCYKKKISPLEETFCIFLNRKYEVRKLQVENEGKCICTVFWSSDPTPYPK